MAKRLILACLMMMSWQLSAAYWCDYCEAPPTTKSRHYFVQTLYQYKEWEGRGKTIWTLDISRLDSCNCGEGSGCQVDVQVMLSEYMPGIVGRVGKFCATWDRDKSTLSDRQNLQGFAEVMSDNSRSEAWVRNGVALLYRAFNHRADEQVLPIVQLLSGEAKRDWRSVSVQQVANRLNQSEVPAPLHWALAQFGFDESERGYLIMARKSSGKNPWEALILEDNDGEIVGVLAVSDAGRVTAELLDIL